jgi:hypothetical protein
LIQIIEAHRLSMLDDSRAGLGARQMPSYRVYFMNEIPRNDKLLHCCQRSIIINSARNGEQAVEAAKSNLPSSKAFPTGRFTPPLST